MKSCEQISKALKKLQFTDEISIESGKMIGSNFRVPVTDNGNDNGEEISGAMRPGGMVVQNREDDAQEQQGFDGSSLMIKVSHGSNLHNITVPSTSTFGNFLFFFLLDWSFSLRFKKQLGTLYFICFWCESFILFYSFCLILGFAIC